MILGKAHMTALLSLGVLQRLLSFSFKILIIMESIKEI